MPEIPNVISNEVIASEWGNDIRDRTVQRYANAAARTAAHVAPVNGDLSYLNDTGYIQVYHSGAWQRFSPTTHGDTHVPGGTDPLGDHGTAHIPGGSDPLSLEVDAAASDSAGVALTASLVSRISVSLAIPASWGGWKAHASATGTYNKAGGVFNAAIRIDGVDSLTTTYNFTPDGNNQGFAVQGRVSGFTTTGSRTVALVASGTAGGAAGTIGDMILYARAIRTA